MAENWRVLDFTYFKGELRFNTHHRKLQVIDADTGDISEHALSDVNVIFVGVGVKLNGGVPYHLAKNDVVTIFCDWKGLPVSSMYPWVDVHGRIAARQRAQASLSAPRVKNAWMRIVKAKIRGQANVLEALKLQGADKLRSIASSVKSGDPENREGQAARVYWKNLFGDEAFVRNPGAREGGRNGLLDYGYTVLRGYSMRAVLSAGLSPSLGLYHKARSNAFALADDLIEPFRPAIDYQVAQLPIQQDIVDADTRKLLLQVCVSAFGGSEKSIPTTMTEFAQHFGQYVEGETAYLDVPIFTPSAEEPSQ